MDKGNKNRIIFWGAIALLLFISFTIGIISYNNGYGKYGKLKKDLMPIINSFNTLEEIKNLKSLDIKINASFEKDKINIVYKTGELLIEYNFKYIINDKRILMATYDNSKYKNINELIVKFMIEAVSIANKHNKDEIFKDFTIEDFKNTSIEDGINIKTIGNEDTVIINLDTYLLDNVHKEEPIIEEYLTKEELEPILNEDKNTIVYKDDKVIIKVNKNIGIILIKDFDNDNARTYRIAQNIIDILYNDKLELFNTEYPTIKNEEYNSNNFNILYLKTISDKDFIGQENVLEIIIKN